MSRRWVYLSIMPDSTIRKKPASFLASTFNAALTCSVKSGCSGNLRTVPPLRILRSRAVHVAEREQPEKFRRLRVIGKRRHFGTGRSNAIARVAKLGDEVGVISTLATFHGLRQEVRAATAHDAVGLGTADLLHAAVVFAA